MQEETITSGHQEVINKACSYLSEGLYVLPGEVGKKYPRNGLVPGCPTVSYDIKDYPDRTALLELFKKFPNSNIIALAGNDFGLVSIDIDLIDGKFTPEGHALIEAFKDYQTYTKKTPSGSLQYLYWIDPKRPLVGRRIGYKPGVDILLDGSSPMPPSKAFSKKINAIGEYTENDPINLQAITLFPYELFPDLIDTPENRQNFSEEKRARIEEQLKSGVITQYRNNTFHHLSVKLNTTFPNNPTVAWHLIDGLYEKYANKEDFSRKELETTFKSALNGRVVAEAKFETQEESSPDTIKFGNPPIVFLNQLNELEIPETTFLVNNLIVEKGINYIYGKTGVCKTWLTLYLALCITKNISAFGNDSFSTKQGKVLFVDTENDLYQTKVRVESLGGLGSNQIGYYLEAGLFKIENQDRVQKLITCIKHHKFKLIVFDIARDIYKGEEDSSTEINKLNQVFKRILQAGCAVLAISHSKKGTDADLVEQLRGSSALGGSAASMILVQQTNDDTLTLQITKSRYVKKIKPIELNILQNNKVITGFEYKGVAKIEPPKKLKDSIEEGILNLAKGVPPPGLPRKDLIQALQKDGYPSEATIDRAIKRLMEKGSVTKDDGGNVMFKGDTS